MDNNTNPIVIEFKKTDKPTPSVMIIAAFLVLVFALIPLAEIVPDFDYNEISHFTRYIDICGWDFYEPISFKEIR